MLDENAGLPKIIEFLNIWANEKDKLNDFLLVRYEDLKQQPHKILKDIANFLGAEANNACIEEAIEFSSYENMKKMEQSGTFWLSGGRLVPRDKDNPDSYKVRRAKVGGYKDYFSDKEVQTIDEIVKSQLNTLYNYAQHQ
jgi:alcohol sulfotransferase